MKIFAIDFESFYDATFGIKIQGSAGYVEDPRFDAYLLSVACDDGFTWVGDPKDFDWTMLAGHIVVAHNASFDEHIYLRYFWDGDPAEFHCTADLAAFCGYPRALDAAMWQAFGKKRDKTVRDRMKGMDRKQAAASPENRAYALEDAVDCLREWQTFSPAWPESERRISRLNREMGWDGVCVNAPYVEECIATLDMEFEIRKKDIPWAETAALGSPIELRKFLTLKGIPVPESTAKNDEDFQEWLDTYAGQVPFVRGIGDLRSIRKTQASFRTLLNRRRADGSFPYSKFYFGAHTGRFAGAGGFNMENLPRDDKFNTNMRAAFIPRPGCAFVIADYSQIEPRVLAWLSGDREFLDLCRQFSPYVAHGIQTGRIKDPAAFEKARKVKGSPEAKTYSGLKAEVLLLGYGGGAVTYQRNAKVYGIDATEAEAAATVKAYRTGKPKVTALWKKLENEFRSRIGSDVYFYPLPSGRNLVYWEPRQRQVIVKGEPRIEMSADTVKGGRKNRPGDATKKIYGGFLCENLVQAVARDVLTDALLRVKDAGFRPLLTVHDEIVIEVPTDSAEEAAKEIRRIMTINPDWMPDVPLDVGMEVATEYRK